MRRTDNRIFWRILEVQMDKSLADKLKDVNGIKAGPGTRKPLSEIVFSEWEVDASV